MAKKTTTTSKTSGTAAVAKSAPVTTAVRNSAVPPKTIVAVAKKTSAVSHEQIAETAYFLWQSGQGGSQDENWFAAERRLRSI